jgi:serine/threonine protein phosphatase PrpC
MKLESAICTHVGRRSNNEDNFLVGESLFAVADGMGGYEGGEIASAIVVESIETFVARGAIDADATWPTGIDPMLTFEENELTAALAVANREVCRKRKGRLASMGATVVALLFRGDHVAVAHVGDSRAYRLRRGRLERLTRDHSLLAELEASGLALPGAQELGGPKRATDFSHVVTRAIGMGESARPDVRSDAIERGDVYLLCSDGLSDVLGDAEIELLLGSDPVASARELVQAAFEAGGSDNITALVVKVRE